MTPSPHDFLLHLRTRRPDLARRLDGIRSLERAGDRLLVRIPEGSWSLSELASRTGELKEEARHFFGTACAVEIMKADPAPEALPFPVLASKIWNHVAFWVWDVRGFSVLAVRKPRYLEEWLPAARAGGDDAVAEMIGPETAWLESSSLDAAGGPSLSDVLPGLVERLCDLGREERSYVQLVTAFPGDEMADRLEARLYSVKEWGTPRVPAAILQKFVGRLHYADPRGPILGLRLAASRIHGTRS